MCKIFPFGRILLLDLGYNCLREIVHNCLSSLWLLCSFYIDNNNITQIEAGAFYNLSNLRYFNISNNPLVNLPNAIFMSSFQLKLFYIVNVNLTDIDIHALHNLRIELIITDDYHQRKSPQVKPTAQQVNLGISLVLIFYQNKQ